MRSTAIERPRFTGFPFTLVVASGSPLPDGVVLWTRLAPDPLNAGAPAIATEFCATSITRRGRSQREIDAILRDNPHIHFGDARRRGYVVFDVTPEQCTARLRVIGDPPDRLTGV